MSGQNCGIKMLFLTFKGVLGWKIKNPSGGYLIFGQWASKYQEQTNHSKVHVRAENFSTNFIMNVLQKKYWTFMRFVDFSFSFQLISLIRWNLLIDWWKVFGPFRQPLHRDHPVNIRQISTGYPPDGFIIFRPWSLWHRLREKLWCSITCSLHVDSNLDSNGRPTQFLLFFAVALLWLKLWKKNNYRKINFTNKQNFPWIRQ